MNEHHESEKSIIDSAIAFYGIMFAIALAVIIWGQENYRELFLVDWEPEKIKDQASLILLSLGVLMIGGYLLETLVKSYQKTKDAIMVVMKDITWWQAGALALMSSVAEELLFRGAIQPTAGLFLTSAIFGLVHIGPDGKISAWTAWAFCAGLIMGAITNYTQTIYPAMIIHFIYNFISILMLNHTWNKLPELKKRLLIKELNELEEE